MASSVLETTVFDVALCLLELLCLAGVGYLAVAALMVRRFVCQAAPVPHVRPPVTLLKPLCGDEPNLYENLRSFCRQDYPGVQVVFGVRTITDPAVAVVERLRAEFSDCDIELVCDARIHGTNLKISNVINMMAKARHDLLVLSDSDMRVRPDYLDAVVAPLLADGQRPPAGLVTCLYRGRPVGGVWSELGSMFINHGFLGQVLVGTLVGSNEGCFGATMALTRDTLARIGGFEASLPTTMLWGRRFARRGCGLKSRRTSLKPRCTSPISRRWSATNCAGRAPCARSSRWAMVPR